MYESGSFLARDKLTKNTRLLIPKGGLDSSKFDGHSIWIGAATCMYNSCLGKTYIMYPHGLSRFWADFHQTVLRDTCAWNPTLSSGTGFPDTTKPFCNFLINFGFCWFSHVFWLVNGGMLCILWDEVLLSSHFCPHRLDILEAQLPPVCTPWILG